MKTYFYLGKICALFQKYLEELEHYLFIEIVMLAEFSVNMNEKHIFGALGESLLVCIDLY
jgi:hypothetical protein